MKSRQDHQTDQPDLDAAELGRLLAAELLEADAMRARRLDAIAQIVEGREAVLERERRRLADVDGDDDPRTVRLARRLDEDRALVAEARLGAERARAATVEAGEDEWVLHGSVLHEDLTPVPDLTVSLHDERGAWIEPLGRACTDERGGFRLTARVPQDRETPKAKGDGPSARIRVHDAEGRLLHADEREIVPRPGATDRVEIVLGRPPRDCPPPPTGKAKGAA
jgi:hypothetical protein